MIKPKKYMKFSSTTLEEAVNTFAKLPGIGKKTALRTVLYLAQKNKGLTNEIKDACQNLLTGLHTCSECNNISDSILCQICADRSRDHATMCVVSSVRDVMAIEETGQSRGVYHVLGGVISPIDGISPQDIAIDGLIERVKGNDVKEIIMAINPTIEGETTIYYISRLLRDYDLKVSILARGIAFGGELEYADELTLGKSILSRTPYTIAE